MAHRAFRRGAAAIRAKRVTSWFDIPFATTTMTAPGGTIVLSLTAAELAKRPFTIVRTVMLIHSTSDQIGADEQQFGAIGMCVVSDQAAAIGVTAVPTPVTDAASDLWFFHQNYASEFAFVTGVGFDAAAGSNRYVESRAMRKVNDDEDVLVIAELAAVGQGQSVTVAGRLLIKES